MSCWLILTSAQLQLPKRRCQSWKHLKSTACSDWMLQWVLITIIFLSWIALLLCQSGVCACVWMSACLLISYFPSPPMTALQLCRYSDSAGAPLVQLLSSSWTSSLIEPRWNKYSPNPFWVINSSSWQLLSLLYRVTCFCRYTFSCILWVSSQTKVFIQASDIIKAVDGLYHVLCFFSHLDSAKVIWGWSLVRGIAVCCDGVYLRRFVKR